MQAREKMTTPQLPDPRADLLSRVRNAADTDELLACLIDLRRQEAADIIREDTLDMRSEIYWSFRDFGIDNVSQLSFVLVDDLVPQCVKSGEDATTDAAHAARTYRAILGAWLKELSESARMAVRAQILRALGDYLTGPGAAGACWTIAAIGYRDRFTVASLWQVVGANPGFLGDIALACITALGVPRRNRRLVIEALIPRARARQNIPLLGALRQVADPRTISVIVNNWFPPESQPHDTDLSHSAVRVLVDIAEQHVEDSKLQDEVWALLEVQFNRLPGLESAILLGSDVVPRCDSPHAVRYLLSYIESHGLGEAGSRRRELVYSRLADCVRPRQVLGWRTDHSGPVRDALHEDASVNTGYTGRSQTGAGMRKKAAWNTLLKLGDLRVPTAETFERCVGAEANPYLRGDFCSSLVAFRMDPLPPTAISWVVEDVDMSRGEAGASLTWRLGASEVVAAVPTMDSFRTLLNFGFRYEGHVLERSVDLLAARGVELARGKGASVEESLLTAAISTPQNWTRVGAIGALQEMAALELLSPRSVDLLEQVADGLAIEPHSREQLLRTLGIIARSRVSESLAALLRAEATAGATANVRWAALGALARLGALAEDGDLLTSALGLRMKDGNWVLTPDFALSEGWVEAVGVLYSRDPERWADLLAEAIRRGQWIVAENAAHVTRFVHDRPDAPLLPEAIENALIARLTEGGPFQEVLYSVLDTAGQLIPSTLVRSSLGRSWKDWQNSRVSVLARAMGESLQVQDQDQALIAEWLLDLVEHPAYSVRRAAYRALVRLAPDRLAAEQRRWTRSRLASRRTRAAEAASWVIMPDWSKLEFDPESDIREAVRVSRQDHLHRTWAKQYVGKLAEVDPASNEAILAAWPYAEALKKIGDEDAAEQITDLLEKRPLNMKMWLRQIREAIDKRVEDLMKERDRDTP